MKIKPKITVKEDRTIDCYFNEVNRYKVLTIDEELNFFQRYKEQNDIIAREKLINHNLRFVISVAKVFYRPNLNGTLNDMINAGNLGLIKAVERFEPTKGFKFISYAVWWIKQNILDYLEKSNNIIRIPNNTYSLNRRVQQERENLYTKTEVEYNNQEMYEMGYISFDEMKTCHKYEIALFPKSLNDQISSDSDTILCDEIADENIKNDVFTNEHNNYIIKKLVKSSKLKKMEINVIMEMFGLNRDIPSNIYELGEKYDMTPERIRQIKSIALTKMKRKGKEMGITNDLL